MDYLYKVIFLLHSYFIDTFADVVNLFFAGNIPYMVLFCICFVFLFWRKDKIANGYGLLGVFSLLYMLAILFNPLWEVVFLKFPSANGPAFARFWLLLPVWLIIAFSLTECLSTHKRAILKGVEIVLLSMVLIFSGDSISSLYMINQTNNIYKINNEAVLIADEILTLSNGEPVVLMIYMQGYGTDDNYVNGGTVFEGIRQYTSLIDVHRYYLYNDEWNAYYVGETTPEGGSCEDYVNEIIAGHQYWNFDYVAMPDDERLNSMIDTERFPLVANVGSFCIYSLKTTD